MLLHVFRRQWKQRRLDYKMLLYQLHKDLQFASRFLSRPIFDEGEWLPTVLKPLWDVAAPYMPINPEEELDHAIIEDKTVSFWFTKSRPTLKYKKIQNTDSERLPPLPLVQTSAVSLAFHCHGRMISYYLDSEEQPKRDSLTDMAKAYLYAHKALAPASAQLLRWKNYNPRIMGVPIDDNCRLLNALGYAIDQCEIFSARGVGNKYLNARMWDLKVILQGFSYEEPLPSQGSVWFEEMVLSYQLGEELQRPLNDLSPASR
ncbi:uncharacterized protein A1O5_09151 [Cladophialophora psammophila CBS 110553]|uniref:Uncharacterized protein n=1 Tax=Cladophialophora psammophila CBS 110553 TaxID=1182543 RepID=W9WS19_9EURO|nr:uncharacterized protein A1O5_09151 [Cladophialophora psammophila CBS 110553]EXJ67805.1 hypothetical protein A1O5_09151 [Cladophialophora psammophila CBS 110553]